MTCDTLREGGAYGMLGHVVSFGLVEGEVEAKVAGLQDELAVAEAATSTLCPDLAPIWEEFVGVLEEFPQPSE